MRSEPWCRAALIVLCSQIVATAATYHVSHRHTSASDTGPGTVERPWKTIGKAGQRAVAGDIVVIHDGIYRERVVVENSGTAAAPIRFEAAPSANVILTGADRPVSWQSTNGPIYWTPWPYRFNTWSETMAHPGDERHRLVGRCEQVFADGYALRQVLQPNHLAPGTFYADLTNALLFVRDIAGRDPEKMLVEASTRSEILRVTGHFVQVRGLRFRYAANAAQHGAVSFRGNNAVVEDCIFDRMNASSAVFAGEDIIVRRCTFRDNGQLGFGANRAHRLLITDCLVENNNTKDFSRGWEAGGNKLVLCRDVVLERSRFLRNRGNGIWFDIGNENCTVRNCLIADNEDAGIFYEISFGLKAHDNVIVGNGFAATPGAWGAQAAISVSSSPDCVIERNLMVGNREGFNFREQARTTPLIDDKRERAVWNHDETIRNNIIALNRDAQVWGWFDGKDRRHWPARQAAVDAPNRPRADDIAAPYVARNRDGQPQGLTLEKLKLQFESNIYFAAPGQDAFVWGPTWTQHRRYATLAEFQAGLGIDRQSRVVDPAFANIKALDFRISRSTMPELDSRYPRGTIPGALLGVRE